MTYVGSGKTLAAGISGVFQKADEKYQQCSEVRVLMEAVALAILEEEVADGVVVDVVLTKEEADSFYTHGDQEGMEALSKIIARREEQTLGRSPLESVSMGNVWVWRDDLEEATRPMVWSDEEGREFITELKDEVDAQSLAVLPLEGADRAVGSITLLRSRESGQYYYDGDRRDLKRLADGLGVRIDGALWRREAKRCQGDVGHRLAIYDRILDGRGVGLLVLSRDAEIMDCNGMAAELLGYGQIDDLKGRLLGPLMEGEGRRWKAHQGLEKAVRQGDDLEVERTIFYRADNSPLPVVVSVVGLESGDAPGEAVMLFRNATKYQGMQADLLAADRVVALGTLASGLAHEINNPLAFTKSNIAFVSKGLEPGGEPREALSEALDGLDRIEEIVAGMKVFSDSGRDELAEMIGLESAIREAVMLCEGALSPHATVVLEGMDQLGSVKAERSRLVQVVMNLLLNAVSAIEDDEGEEQGRITVVGGREEEEYRIEVIDNGTGISPEALDSIFDPFFTTREKTGKTQGSGLGLYICRVIAMELGGAIEVESAQGEGAIFRIRLPHSDMT